MSTRAPVRDPICGMAVSADAEGTDVAMESADVTLISGSLRGVVTAIEVSRATMRNVRQNLFGAFVYNALGLPVAAGVLFPFFGIPLSPILLRRFEPGSGAPAKPASWRGKEV